MYKLGIAGFAFGNIMFLSLPEYFDSNEFWLDQYKPIFRWLMFVFSLPVVFYAARGYFISAIRGFYSKVLNIDVPISVGILALFIRSTVDISMDWGTGFFDSLSGFIFFLLLGRFFQQKTYAFLSFERDYKSYFPIAVTRISNTLGENTEEQVQINQLQIGDRILIRNDEIIPIDGILVGGEASIDYSFVTGENLLVAKKKGDLIYAGGRQKGIMIEVEVLKKLSQSYLTQLWELDVFKKDKQSNFTNITDRITKMFSISILSIAIVATIFWVIVDPSKSINVFTAVLIVACPCAIALAAPFTLGNILRLLGQDKLYLKNSVVIEQMAQIDTVVFDKTGTLTSSERATIDYHGQSLSNEEKVLLLSALKASNHPLSRALYHFIYQSHHSALPLLEFKEEIGKGIRANIAGNSLKLGSESFVITKKENNSPKNKQSTKVFIEINDTFKGYFSFSNYYREGIQTLINKLAQKYDLVILSGDNESEKTILQKMLPPQTKILFNQSPQQKLNFIQDLQQKGGNVMMIGDGLNDSGALVQSDVGIALSDNINSFTPASDGIIDAEVFHQLFFFLKLSKQSIKVIRLAFVFSLFYNLIGLGFAVSGQLTPIVAAILMPLSSMSIVVFTTIATHLLNKNKSL